MDNRPEFDALIAQLQADARVLENRIIGPKRLREILVGDYILLRRRAVATVEALREAMTPAALEAEWTFEDVLVAAEQQLPGVNSADFIADYPTLVSDEDAADESSGG